MFLFAPHQIGKNISLEKVEDFLKDLNEHIQMTKICNSEIVYQQPMKLVLMQTSPVIKAYGIVMICNKKPNFTQLTEQEEEFIYNVVYKSNRDHPDHWGWNYAKFITLDKLLNHWDKRFLDYVNKHMWPHLGISDKPSGWEECLSFRAHADKMENKETKVFILNTRVHDLGFTLP